MKGPQPYTELKSTFTFCVSRSKKPGNAPLRPGLSQDAAEGDPGARHLHAVQKGRYAGSAILSPRQASQSQQAACSTTPCSVWTRGPGSGAQGPVSEPTTKKRSMIQWSSVASVNGGEATCVYTTYIRGYIYAVYLYMCVLI